MGNYKNKIVERVEEQQKEKPDYPLTINEAAEYLKVSQANLYRLTSHKLIPFYKPAGKLIYFFKSELDEWIVKNEELAQQDRVEVKSETEDRKRKEEELVIEFPLKSRRKKLTDFSSQKSDSM